jgi:hypothetical protein
MIILQAVTSLAGLPSSAPTGTWFSTRATCEQGYTLVMANGSAMCAKLPLMLPVWK